MVKVYEYFSDGKTNGYTLAAFRKDWAELSANDKLDLKTGVENGSLDY